MLLFVDSCAFLLVSPSLTSPRFHATGSHLRATTYALLAGFAIATAATVDAANSGSVRGDGVSTNATDTNAPPAVTISSAVFAVVAIVVLVGGILGEKRRRVAVAAATQKRRAAAAIAAVLFSGGQGPQGPKTQPSDDDTDDFNWEKHLRKIKKIGNKHRDPFKTRYRLDKATFDFVLGRIRAAIATKHIGKAQNTRKAGAVMPGAIGVCDSIPVVFVRRQCCVHACDGGSGAK